MAITIQGVKRKDRNTIEPGEGAVVHGRDVHADGSNTGIAGIGVSSGSLTNTGATTYSTNGQTITGRRFTGTVSITGSNITLSGCQIDLAGSFSKGIYVTGNNVTIEDCTIFATSGQSMYMCIHASGGTGLMIRRVNATGGENVVTIETSGVTIEDSYLHHPSNASNPGGHKDVIEVYGGSDTLIQRSRLVHDADETAVINIAPWFGSTSVANTIVQDCYIDGGIMHFVVDLQSTGTITYTKVLRNDMGGHTAPGVIGRYAALNNSDGRSVVNTQAAQNSAPNSILWPTSGGDQSYWVDCADLSPDRTGQVISP